MKRHDAFYFGVGFVGYLLVANVQCTTNEPPRQPTRESEHLIVLDSREPADSPSVSAAAHVHAR